MSEQTYETDSYSNLVDDLEQRIKADDRLLELTYCFTKSFLYGVSGLFGGLFLSEIAKTNSHPQDVALSAVIGSFLVDIPGYVTLKQIETMKRNSPYFADSCSLDFFEKFIKYEGTCFFKLAIGSGVTNVSYKDTLLSVMIGLPGFSFGLATIIGILLCLACICNEHISDVDDEESQNISENSLHV